jgi:hypothetical protein
MSLRPPRSAAAEDNSTSSEVDTNTATNVAFRALVEVNARRQHDNAYIVHGFQDHKTHL